MERRQINTALDRDPARCLLLVREAGIEPATGAWKALALPLRHSRARCDSNGRSEIRQANTRLSLIGAVQATQRPARQDEHFVITTRARSVNYMVLS